MTSFSVADGTLYPPDGLDGFQQEALRTLAPKHDLEYCALGLSGEAGEVADLVKKHVYHEHPWNDDRILEELGDALWYVATAAHRAGYLLSAVAYYNTRKLRRRYPDGFSAERSLHRS